MKKTLNNAMKKKLIKLEQINYDPPTIIQWQKDFEIKYNKKLRW